jgi:hypothetical protein
MPVTGKNVDLSADFKSIKTYNWTSDIDNIPGDAYLLDLTVLIFSTMNQDGK